MDYTEINLKKNEEKFMLFMATFSSRPESTEIKRTFDAK